MLLHLLHWWWCPRTVEAAAIDYERHHLASGGRDWLLHYSLHDLPSGVLTDLSRIVGYRYGLLNRVIRPADEVWEVGWNSRLIRNGGGDARQTALRILGLVRAVVLHRATDAEPSAGADIHTPRVDEGQPTGTSPDLGRAHLRVARPTDNLAAVLRFYLDGLGFEVLGSFEDHAGFDGVMLGRAGAAYHLEFTRKAGHTAGRAPSEDNLLVFYLPDESAWRAAVARLEVLGYSAVKSFNPYWDRNGCTFEDPDGYRVVLQNAVCGVTRPRGT